MSSNDRSIKRFKKLKSLGKNVKWENKKERSKFLRRLYNSMKSWQKLLPNLWKIFRKEEIDSLLSDSICYVDDEDSDITESAGKVFVKFVVHVSYKVDEDSKPLSDRATKYEFFLEDDVIRELIKIYDGFNAKKCRVSKTADATQHLALKNDKEKTSNSLQRRGAGLNLSNEERSTPLLTYTCTRIENKNSVQIYVVDKDKTTRQLHFAVTRVLPNEVIELLKIGADPSSFAFPTPTHFVVSINARPNDSYVKFELRLASGSLIIVERLKKKGYEFGRNEALTIMQLFAKYNLFESSEDVENNWYDHEKFARIAKKMMINPSQSLYDLIQLPPKQASKILSYKGYFQLKCVDELWLLPQRLGRACVRHLCEKLSREFFLKSVLFPFLELTHYRLPILCCVMIFENLKNEDLYRICLAAQDQSRENSEENSTTNVIIRNNTG
ncbi:hypothetical protein TKK_0009111 [Trichogramma kaykai]